MLILTRTDKKGKNIIFIGGDIEIIVLGVKGNQVRVGINAPDDVNIVRGELEKDDERKN